MELILGGFFVVFSGILADISEREDYVSGDELKDSNESMGRQYRFMVAFGCLLILLGLAGFASGAYSFAIGVRERLLLALLLFWMNVQLRVVTCDQNNRDKRFSSQKKRTNLLEVFSKAFSIGAFPRVISGYALAITVTQIGIVLVILSIVLYR